MSANTTAKQLADLLITHNFEPEMLDSSGKAATSAEDAEIFSFNFITDNGTDHGTVVIMLGDDKNLTVFSGDNVGRGMDSEDKNQWYEFQHQLKNFATRNFLTFGSQSINKLKYSMQGQAALKEGLFESWNGTKNVSWNGGPDSVRLMIKHKRPLGVNEARFRQVESLFVETSEGERYKLPFRNLAGGRAMVEHVRQGGKPYDMRGAHIANMVEELNVLSRFRRASKGQVFEGDTANLVNETNAYYETVSRSLKGLSSSRGYSKYFESWNPAEVTGQDVIIEDLKSLFVQETIDSRIEQALPILARIQQQGNIMKEANIFEAWADQLVEGTWSIPNTPEQQQELIALMSKELPVGADAINATEQLYSLFGDDQLFDDLQELAAKDANADARPLVMDRMRKVAAFDSSISELLAALEQPAEAPQVDEGNVKNMLFTKAENMSKEEFVADATAFGMDESEAVDFWNNANGVDDEYNDNGLSFDDSMDGDHDSAMASAGFGSDEDYGYYGDDSDLEEMKKHAGMGEGEHSYRPSGDDVAGKNPEKMTAGDKLRNFINAVTNKVAPDDETLLKDLEKKTIGEAACSECGMDPCNCDHTMDESENKSNDKEPKKDDSPPFDDGHPVTDQHKDEFGNVIKDKNMAKHLAKKGMKSHMEEQATEDEQRLSIGQQMARDGITYSPDRERELIGLIGDYLAKNGHSNKQIRYYLSYDEDFVPDTLSELPRAEQVTEDTDTYSVLSGQYGHSGKLQEFEKVEDDILSRLKQLSGLIRSM